MSEIGICMYILQIRLYARALSPTVRYCTIITILILVLCTLIDFK